MYEYEVLTIHNVEFEDNGKKVKGVQLWLGCQTKDPTWNGYQVDKVWIPDGHALEDDVMILSHGDRVKISFNRKGKPEAINLVA